MKLVQRGQLSWPQTGSGEDADPEIRDGRWGDRRGGTSKRLAHSHHRKEPAELLLVDSKEIRDGVEFLLSQYLFRHLRQEHAINHSGGEDLALRRGQNDVCAPSLEATLTSSFRT